MSEVTSSADPGVDLAHQLDRLGPWYHTIDLGDGIKTPGKSNVEAKVAQLEPHLPSSVAGLKVLDVGCNAGGLSVAMARRGARVTGIESSRHYFDQACWVRDYLGLDIDYRLATAYEIDGVGGPFDIVLFLGIVYHLRHPQAALDLVASVCRGRVFIATPIIDTPTRALELRLPPDEDGRIAPDLEGRYNWWFPSPGALTAMLAAAGFTDVTAIWRAGRPFVSSSPDTDNTSSFPTDTLLLTAVIGPDGPAQPSALAPRATA